MQQWLDRMDYGNRDISGGIDQFWLSSSLLITPQAQLAFLKRLRQGTLPFRPDVQRQVSDMLLQSSELDGQLHGKTGSCRGKPGSGAPDHGWFIGWVDWNARNERNPVTTWFVVNVRGEKAWGTTRARPIALRLLAQQQP
jgi:beta-lactamase class D